MIIGVFSFVKRVGFSVALNLMQIFRVDTCVTPRNFESYDSGFVAYIGLLEVRVAIASWVTIFSRPVTHLSVFLIFKCIQLKLSWVKI